MRRSSASKAGTLCGAVRAVEFRNVTKRFALGSGSAEELTAVGRVNLTIKQGEFVCVLGPSGHVKNTMLNLLAGFIAPTEGQVLHVGRPVIGPGQERGVVFQRDEVPQGFSPLVVQRPLAIPIILQRKTNVG